MCAFKREKLEFPLSLTVAPGRDRLLDWRLPFSRKQETAESRLKVFVRKWRPELPDTIIDQLSKQKELEICPTEAEADLVVQVRPEGYDITTSFDPLRPLVARVEGLEGYNPTLVLDFLTHIHRWKHIQTYYSDHISDELLESTLSSSTGSKITAEGSPLEIFRINQNGGPPVQQSWEPGRYPELRLNYEPDSQGGWSGQIRLKLTNIFEKPLHYSVLFLSQNFEIMAGLHPNGQLMLQPGESRWLNDGNPIDLFLEDQIVHYMWQESNSGFLVLAAPEPFDTAMLRQEGLPMPGQPRAPRKASYFVRTGRPALLPLEIFALAQQFFLIQPNPLFEEGNLFDMAGDLVRTFSPESDPQEAGVLSTEALKVMWQKAENGKMTDIFRRLDRLQSDLEKALAWLGSDRPQAANTWLLEILQVMEEINERPQQTP